MVKMKLIIISIVISVGLGLWFVLPIFHHEFHGWVNAQFLKEPYTLAVWFEPRIESIMVRWYFFGALQGLLFALFLLILSLVITRKRTARAPRKEKISRKVF